MSVHPLPMDEEQSRPGGADPAMVALGQVPQERTGIEEEMLPHLTGDGVEVPAINDDLDRLLFLLELPEQVGLEPHGLAVAMGHPQDHDPGAPNQGHGDVGTDNGVLGVAADRLDGRDLPELFQVALDAVALFPWPEKS